MTTPSEAKRQDEELMDYYYRHVMFELHDRKRWEEAVENAYWRLVGERRMATV